MAMVLALTFLFLLLLPFNGNAAGIAVLWGDNRYDGSLNSTCATGNYNYVSIQLGIHCNPRIKYSCKRLGAEIKYCQSQGIKVVLSLQSRYLLMSSSDSSDLNNQWEWDDPIEFSNYLIVNYLGGNKDSPFGDDVVMDGFDFGSPYGYGQFYYLVARSLKDYGGHNVYLVASPNCRYPDYTLGPAINDGYFDALWVQFHHNPQCQYDPYRHGGVENLLKSWDLWTTSNTDKVFIGVLAAPESGWGGDGYIPPEILSRDIIYNVKNSPKYGGVMLWDRYRDINSGFSKAINVSLHMPNLPTSIISM